MAEVIPMVVKYSSQAPEGNDELKEACLQVQTMTGSSLDCRVLFQSASCVAVDRSMEG